MKLIIIDTLCSEYKLLLEQYSQQQIYDLVKNSNTQQKTTQ